MRTFVLLFIVVAVALAASGGVVAAQENTTNQSQPNAPENQSAVVGDPLDEDITLTSWEFSGGTFLMTFDLEGERPKQITISEATQPGEGAQQFAIREERLLPGETTVSMSTQIRNDEAAVSITSADSLASGTGIVVSTGEQGGDDPFAPFGGTSGVFSGVGLSILMSGSAAGWVLWREEKGVITA